MLLPSRPQTSQLADFSAYLSDVNQCIDEVLGLLKGDERGVIKVYNYKALPSDLRAVKRDANILDGMIFGIEANNNPDLSDKWHIIRILLNIDAVVKRSRPLYKFIALNRHEKENYPDKTKALEKLAGLLGRFGEMAVYIVTYFKFPKNSTLSEVSKEIERQISNSFSKNSVRAVSERKRREEGSLIDEKLSVVHPGKILEKYLIDSEWSVIYAAERLGMTRVHVYRVINGKTNISPSTAKALERNNIGGSALDWLVLQAKFDLAQPDRPPTKKRRVNPSPKV